MKVSDYRATEPVEELSGVSKREVITADDGAENFTMRIFEIDPGNSTPPHNHPFEHEVFVLSGKGVVIGGQGAIAISKEMVVFVAPNETHCFVNTGNEPLRFICIIPLQKE